MRAKFLVVLFIVAGSTSCSSSGHSGTSSNSSPDIAGTKAAIAAANSNFLDAFRRGDKARMIANYSDDAVLMMPNEETWRGREGIDKGFSGFLSQVSFKDGAATTTDVMVAGDLAVETGTYAWTLQPKSGADVKDKGKYLTVWE